MPGTLHCHWIRRPVVDVGVWLIMARSSRPSAENCGVGQPLRPPARWASDTLTTLVAVIRTNDVYATCPSLDLTKHRICVVPVGTVTVELVALAMERIVLPVVLFCHWYV